MYRRRPFVVATLACLVMLAAVAPVSAQAPAADTWNVTFAPYFMGAAMKGTVAVAGQEATLDMSASDILSNLQSGAMDVAFRF